MKMDRWWISKRVSIKNPAKSKYASQLYQITCSRAIQNKVKNSTWLKTYKDLDPILMEGFRAWWVSRNKEETLSKESIKSIKIKMQWTSWWRKELVLKCASASSTVCSQATPKSRRRIRSIKSGKLWHIRKWTRYSDKIILIWYQNGSTHSKMSSLSTSRKRVMMEEKNFKPSFKRWYAPCKVKRNPKNN